ncbi:unnamed protein product [Diabrotica balteata]|uniref:Uncharacterized protein n=1 Tax=Diabrotica balteata TaxID=107213 RepID=A0A9N9XAZ4_DIABA|nr:unnamed protein product [Diabrotica balteata]
MEVSNYIQAAQPEDLTIRTYTFKGLREFIYLGLQVNQNYVVSAEINRRIHLANRAYYGLKKKLTTTLVTKRTKLVIYRTLIKPILTYASETWTMTKSDEQCLRCFECKILRHICGGVQEGRL